MKKQGPLSMQQYWRECNPLCKASITCAELPSMMTFERPQFQARMKTLQQAMHSKSNGSGKEFYK